MKGYEDIAATLAFLAVVLVGGYVYLNHQVIKQKEVLQVPEKRVELNMDKKEGLVFQQAVKVTE